MNIRPQISLHYLITVLFFCFLTCAVSTAVSASQAVGDRPKVGLVLSGGGAKGLAHIGVLKELERHKIKIDYIVGTSMGAIVGGLYAAGYTAKQIEEIAVSQPWADLLGDRISRKSLSFEEKIEESRYTGSFPIRNRKINLPRGLIAGQRISALLSRLTWSVHHIEDFSQLAIPFRCVAADIEVGESIVIDSGYLPDAIRASMSIPSVFNPVELDGRILVDGGIIDNFPARVAVDMGAEIIIGVDVSDRLKSKDELNSFVEIMDQLIGFRVLYEAQAQHVLCDVVVQPQLDDYSVLSFEDVVGIIEQGEAAARNAESELNKIATSQSKYMIDDYRPIPVSQIDSIYIKNVRFEGLNNVSTALVNGTLRIGGDSWVKPDELEQAVERVYGTRFFERVTYKLVPSESGSDLIIRLQEQSADFFHFGFHYDTHLKASVLLNATFRNAGTEGSKLFLDTILGETPGVEAGYFIPIRQGPGLGTRFNLSYNQFKVYDYIGDRKSASFDIKRFTAGTQVKSLFSNLFTAGLGIQGDYYEQIPIVSPVGTTKQYGTFFSYYGFMEIDSFDRGVLPRSGLRASMELRNVSRELTNDHNSEFSSFLRFSMSVDNYAPVSSVWTLRTGGFLGRIEGDNAHPAYIYYAGGMNTFGHQVIAVNGLDYMQLSGRNLVTFWTGIRYKVATEQFITLSFNAVHATDRHRILLDFDRFITTTGITFSLNSPIGPIEYGLYRNSLNSEYSGIVNIGYSF